MQYYIMDSDVLLPEELTGRTIDDNDPIVKATKLFRENIKLAVNIAYKYKYIKSIHFDLDDLMQLAYTGLWYSCLHFDESKGAAFSTYAVPNIQGTILRYMRDNEYTMKLPRWFQDISSYLGRSEYTLPLSEEDIQEILEKTEFKESQLRQYSYFRMSSLDDSVSSDKETLTLGELIPSIDKVGEELTEDEIESLVDNILKHVKFENARSYDIVEEWLYSEMSGTPITQYMLRDKYKVSQAQISRVLNKAISDVAIHKKQILEAAGFN